MIDRYYAAYPGVRAYLDETVADAHRDGFAQTLFGRKRRIPELASSNYNLRSFGERTAMNHPMQGTAADIMKLAMIEVDRRLRHGSFAARMVLQVHDELVFEAPAEEVAAARGDGRRGDDRGGCARGAARGVGRLGARTGPSRSDGTGPGRPPGGCAYSTTRWLTSGPAFAVSAGRRRQCWPPADMYEYPVGDDDVLYPRPT